MVGDEMHPVPEVEYVRASYLEDDTTQRAMPMTIALYFIWDILVTCVCVYILLPNIWGIALVFLMSALFVWRRFTSYDVWYSSPEGLQVQGSHKYQSIKWSDVIDVYSSRRKHTIKIADASIRIPIKWDIQFLRLEASIWQHLHSVGLSDKMEITRGARGFLIDLPPDVDSEVEWRNNDIGWTVYAPLFVILIMLAAVYEMYISHILALDIMYMLAMLMWFAFIIKMVREWLSTAKYVSIKNGMLTAKTVLRTVEWRICDLRKVRWIYLCRLELCVNGRRVIMPFSEKDPEARRFILALIKSLRENHSVDVLPIPYFLQDNVKE